MRGIMKTKRLGDLSRGAMLKATTWLRQEKGSLNVLYALALIPMIGALGLATDTARGYLLKARLSQAIDQAVLAGGKVYFLARPGRRCAEVLLGELPEYGRDFLSIRRSTPISWTRRLRCNSPVEGGDAGSETLHLTATATIPTTFMRVLNAFGCTACNEMTVFAEAEVERTIRALDAVISLDMSGSMDGVRKIGAARDGLEDFMDQVYGVSNSGFADAYGLRHDLQPDQYRLCALELQSQRHDATARPSPAPQRRPCAPTQIRSPVRPASRRFGRQTIREVPLIMNPRDTSAGGQLPGGWSGCIYARYVGGEGDARYPEQQHRQHQQQ